MTDDLKFPDDGALGPVIVKGLVRGHVAVNSSIISRASTGSLWRAATGIMGRRHRDCRRVRRDTKNAIKMIGTVVWKGSRMLYIR